MFFLCEISELILVRKVTVYPKERGNSKFIKLTCESRTSLWILPKIEVAGNDAFVFLNFDSFVEFFFSPIVLFSYLFTFLCFLFTFLSWRNYYVCCKLQSCSQTCHSLFFLHETIYLEDKLSVRIFLYPFLGRNTSMSCSLSFNIRTLTCTRYVIDLMIWHDMR